jgi:hypothetical protein
LGFRVWGLGCRVEGLGFRVWGLGFRVQGLGFRGYRVDRRVVVAEAQHILILSLDLGFRVWGLGFRILGAPRCRYPGVEGLGVQGLGCRVGDSV